MKRSEVISFVREQHPRIKEAFNKAIETKSDVTHSFVKQFWEFLIPSAHQQYGRECLEWELPLLWKTANLEGENNTKENQKTWWRRILRPLVWPMLDFVAEIDISELPVEQRKEALLGLFAASLYLNCQN